MIKYYVCSVCMCFFFFFLNTFTSSCGERESSALQTGLSQYNSLRPFLLTFFSVQAHILWELSTTLIGNMYFNEGIRSSALPCSPIGEVESGNGVCSRVESF